MFRLATCLVFVLTVIQSTDSFGQRVTNERQAWYLPPCPGSDVDTVDAVERSILDGTFQIPADDVFVTCSNGQKGAWRYVDIGTSRHSFDVEPGSWLYFSLTDLPAGPAFVDLSGHQRFYVNGEARSGRPKGAGMMKYPVNLKEGDNEILVHVKDGPVLLKVTPLAETDDTIRFLQYDRVLPWLDDLQPVDVHASLLLVNAGPPLNDLRIATKTRFKPLNEWADYPDDAVPGVWQYEAVDSIPGWSMTKIPFQVIGPPPHKRSGIPYPVDVQLQRASDGEVLATFVFNMSTRNKGNHELRTWRDRLGTVQSCMVLPPVQEAASSPPVIVALPTTLRSVHSTVYAYEEGPDELIIVPGMRRVGLGGTTMGRSHIDESIEHVRTLHAMDTQRMAINGYADAGRNAWDTARRRPGMFCGVVPIGTNIALEDDRLLNENLAEVDLIFRHGELDETIDPDMVSRLKQVRGNCEGRTLIDIRPDMERWWGAPTISDDALAEFLFESSGNQARTMTIDLVHDHTTRAHEDHWALVHQRKDCSRPARLTASHDNGRLMIQTENVRQLLIRGEPLEIKGPLDLEVDGKSLVIDSDVVEICLQHEKDGWQFADGCDTSGKSRLRSHYEHLFSRPLLMVHGTGGDADVARANWAKARFDAEQFWSLADGSARLVADRDLTPKMLDGVNVILYGNVDTNSAWAELLPNSPIVIRTGSLQVGDQIWEGDDLVTRFIRPLPGDRAGLVVAVGTSNSQASRLVQPIPVTDPTAELTDWMVMSHSTMGAEPLRGDFDRDWKLVD